MASQSIQTRFRNPVLAALLAVALVAVPAAAEEPDTTRDSEAAPEQEQPYVVLEIRGMHYDVGGPVTVRVTARNDGEESVDNPLTDPIPRGLVLTGDDGKVIKPEAVGDAEPQARPKQLAGGTYFGQVLNLADYFPALKKKGRFDLSYDSGSGSSNSVTLRVIEKYDPEAEYQAIIKTAMGELTVRLYRQDAPIAVQNFVDLARQGFYNGLTFHYVRPGDILMGGDPRGDGTGGSGFLLPAEFNSRQHLAGTLGMVRGADPNSASSQFYICLAPQPERDGRFTVFGQITDGMETLNRLGEVPTSGRNTKPYFRPLEPLVIESVTIIQKAGDEASGS